MLLLFNRPCRNISKVLRYSTFPQPQCFLSRNPFFFPLRQILRSRVSAALVVDISNDTQQFGWRSPQRHTTTTHHALQRHTSLLHTWLVFFATVSGFAFTASYQHPPLQTESRMLMRSREGISRQSVNHYIHWCSNRQLSRVLNSEWEPFRKSITQWMSDSAWYRQKKTTARSTWPMFHSRQSATTYLTDRITTDWSSTRGILQYLTGDWLATDCSSPQCLGLPSATTHGSSVDAVRNDTRQLHSILFIVAWRSPQRHTTTAHHAL